MFSSKLHHSKLQNFLPIRLNHSGPSGAVKTSKFLSYNVSSYNFEKLKMESAAREGAEVNSKVNGRSKW